MKDTCRTCRFWAGQQGWECHRRAPAALPAIAIDRGLFDLPYKTTATDGAAIWPRTRPEDWCGEHEART